MLVVAGDGEQAYSGSEDVNAGDMSYLARKPMQGLGWPAIPPRSRSASQYSPEIPPAVIACSPGSHSHGSPPFPAPPQAYGYIGWSRYDCPLFLTQYMFRTQIRKMVTKTFTLSDGRKIPAIGLGTVSR